jgi:hypothetical protein
VVFVAVVRTLSPSSAVASANEGASEVVVNVDCVDNLEAFEALGFRPFAAFFGGDFCLYSVTRPKKEQSGERL